jgi:hypothetical protein
MLPHGSVISAGAFCSGFSSKVAEGAIGDGVSSGEWHGVVARCGRRESTRGTLDSASDQACMEKKKAEEGEGRR